VTAVSCSDVRRGDKGLARITAVHADGNIGELNEQGELELLFESDGRQTLDGPDNDDQPRGRS
jgi:hypothetical protein